MPLALEGFTLQSFPLGSSTLLSSRLVTSGSLVDRPSLIRKHAS